MTSLTLRMHLLWHFAAVKVVELPEIWKGRGRHLYNNGKKVNDNTLILTDVRLQEDKGYSHCCNCRRYGIGMVLKSIGHYGEHVKIQEWGCCNVLGRLAVGLILKLMGQRLWTGENLIMGMLWLLRFIVNDLDSNFFGCIRKWYCCDPKWHAVACRWFKGPAMRMLYIVVISLWIYEAPKLSLWVETALVRYWKPCDATQQHWEPLGEFVNEHTENTRQLAEKDTERIVGGVHQHETHAKIQ